MTQQQVTVNYDDQPEEVARKFVEAIKALGIDITDVTPEKGLGVNKYNIQVEEGIALTRRFNTEGTKTKRS